MLKHMKLGMRLGLGFGMVLAFLAVMMVIVIISLNSIEANMTRIVNVNEYKMNLCQTMSNSIYKIMLDTRGLILTDDMTGKENLKKEIEGLRAIYNTSSEALDKTPATDAGMQLRTRIKEELAAARPLTDKVTDLSAAGNNAEATRVLMDESGPVIKSLLDSLDEAVKLQADTNVQEAAAAKANNQTSLIIIIALGIASVVLGLVVAYAVTLGITKPVNRIVTGLSEGAQQVASASDQLSATSQQLAEGNSEQAASIEETSSTLEESASMVQQNSENTKQAAHLAAQTKTSSDKGNNDMQEMMNSISEIKKSSDQIAKIIKVIDDIAFQTNILALNAAVEAARAGDAGMGFAVVAEEVRNLAQRSAQAAKDTAAIIESNIELSEKGVNVARKVGDSLSEINVQAKKVNELMDEIAAASQEQSQGISQIHKAIAQMEQVTQQNAANAQESASASEELSSQAQNLRDITQQLVELINGKSVQNNDIHASYKNTTKRYVYETNNKPVSKHQSVFRSESKNLNPEDIIPLKGDTGEF